jgi:hypothetical protein
MKPIDKMELESGIRSLDVSPEGKILVGLEDSILLEISGFGTVVSRPKEVKRIIEVLNFSIKWCSLIYLWIRATRQRGINVFFKFRSLSKTTFYRVMFRTEELWGCAVNPADPNEFVTSGDDSMVFKRDITSFSTVRS